MRPFSADSFWNTPLPVKGVLLTRSSHYLELLKRRVGRGFRLNLQQWTTPVYEADPAGGLSVVGRQILSYEGANGFDAPSLPYLHPDHPLGHHASFERGVPIPPFASPDAELDSHMSIIDTKRGRAWDMWGVTRRGDGWASCTGISYRLDGPGVFDRNEFAVHDDESIHFYGPARASGVPAIAGIVRHDEIVAGRIEHKLAFGCNCTAYKEFYSPPACWTDGWLPGGIPEGAVIQLDPAFDPTPLGLSPGALVIVQALKTYGAVNVDNAGGAAMMGEGLWGHPGLTWDGLLTETDLYRLPWSAFRFVDLGAELVLSGMHPRHHDGMRPLHEAYLDAITQDEVP